MNSSPLSNIGMVTWDYRPPKGGLGRAFQQMQAALVASSPTTVSVLSSTGGTHNSATWTRRFGGHIAFSAVLLFSLQRWINRTARHLLLFPCGPGGIFLLRKPKGCKVVAVVYHTYAQQCRLVPGQWWKRLFVSLERLTLRKADHILCYAEDTRQVLLRTYHLDERRVTLLPQLIPLQPWVPTKTVKDKNLCVCIARLEQRKGVLFLLRVWERVQVQAPQATLILVGDGIQAAKIDRLILRKKLSVQRIPSLPQNELIALVQSARMLLCPSFLEGFGLTATEAMASETLVLASDTDGLRSLMTDARTGVLIEPGNQSAWVQAIQEYLADTEKGKDIALCARAEVCTRFAYDHSIRALQECLKQVYSAQ